jgi:hypothetical protein
MDIERSPRPQPEKILKQSRSTRGWACRPTRLREARLAARPGREARAQGVTEDRHAGSTPRSWRWTAASPRSTRWSSPAGEVMALDAKMNFDDNALYRQPECGRAARPRRRGSEGDRGERSSTSTTSSSTATSAAWSTAPAWPWRRWTSSSTSAAAGELPRRRRRRHHREGHRGVQDHPGGQEREGHPRQHLRRHHEVRRHRRGRHRGGARVEASTCRSWSASRAPTSSWASEDPRDSGLAITPADSMARRRRREDRRGRREGALTNTRSGA